MPHVVASALWQDLMVRQLQGLGRWVEGRLVTEPDSTRTLVPAERYLDRAYLRQAIDAAVAIGRDPADAGAEPIDVRIAASRFSRHYASALSTVALTGLARGVGIDVSMARCTMVLDYNVPMLAMIDVPDRDVLRCAERPTAWPVDGPVVGSLDELRAYVWRRLYSENIEPVFARVLELVNVSPKLLWANAAEWVGMVSDAAAEYLEASDAAPFIADRKALLDADVLPGRCGPNPLRHQLDWVPSGADGFPSEVQTRRLCCLTYLLPDRRGRLCQNCGFLSLEDRVALTRERHGVSRGNPTGPAEQRSIDAGLAKLEHVHRSP